MKRGSNLFNHALKFMLIFIIFSILMLAVFAFTLILSSLYTNDLSITGGISAKDSARPEDIDWEEVGRYKGYGILVDEEGNIKESFNKEVEGRIGLFDALENYNYNNNDYTFFSYDSPDNLKLLVVFPEESVSLQPTLHIDRAITIEDNLLEIIGIIVLLIYLLGTYFLIRRLYRTLVREQKLLVEEENEKKNELFRGLAHDMKTPLSSVIGYSNALKDGLIKEENLNQYYEKINKNGRLLETRLNDMMNFTFLSDKDMYKFEKGDILEEVRRYVGDNYSFFVENDADIEILFDDKDLYITKFDKALFDRVLQNILQNSVHHNEGHVNISIDYKKDTLNIKDDGIGIRKDLWEKIFEPMVTGDASRTGDKNRGLGLANVKRIADLHGWQVYYDEEGFSIKFK